MGGGRPELGDQEPDRLGDVRDVVRGEVPELVQVRRGPHRLAWGVALGTFAAAASCPSAADESRATVSFT